MDRRGDEMGRMAIAALNRGSRRNLYDDGNNSNNGAFACRLQDSRVVSANSSFFRLILSFKVSASRRACWMRACMASGDTSFGRCESMAAMGCVSGERTEEKRENWMDGDGRRVSSSGADRLIWIRE